MSILIRDGRIEVDDWTALDDEAALPAPAGARVIVSLDRWLRDRKPLLASGAAVGVQLPNTADVDALVASDAALLDRPLLALSFPAFADGRAYSQARLLSQRHRFRGELRATGAAVVRDQLHFMSRCGFTAFLLRPDQDASAALGACKDFDLAYQPAADTGETVLERRRAATS